MKIQANLNGNLQANIDLKEPVILPENELKIICNSDIYNISTLLLYAKNGEKEIKVKFKPSREVDLSELLFPGIIEIEISMLVKSEVVKTWRVQDIIVKDIHPQYEIIPEIAEIKEAMKEVYEVFKRNNLI